MTAQRYDLIVGEEGADGKTYWTNIGTMFPSKDGKDEFQIIFKALPLPRIYNGKVTVSVRAVPPKDRDESRPSGGSSRGTRAQEPLGGGRSTRSTSADLSDDIPFGPDR